MSSNQLVELSSPSATRRDLRECRRVVPSKKAFAETLNAMLAERKRRPADLAKAIGVDPSLVSHWKRAKNLPDATRLDKVAEYFGVEVSQMFEGAKASALDRAVTLVNATLGYETIKKNG